MDAVRALEAAGAIQRNHEKKIQNLLGPFLMFLLCNNFDILESFFSLVSLPGHPVPLFVQFPVQVAELAEPNVIIDGHLPLAVEHVIADKPLEADRVGIGLLEPLLLLFELAQHFGAHRHCVEGQLASDLAEPGLDLLPEQLAAHLYYDAAGPHRCPILLDGPLPAAHTLPEAVIRDRLVGRLHAIHGETFLGVKIST